jgi:hypothetical protein
MNSYAPRRADEQLQRMAAELRRYQQEALGAQRELAAARRRIWELEQSASVRIEQLLDAAREQVAEVVRAAEAKASEIREAAEGYAAGAGAAADQESAALRARAAADAEELRRAARRDIEAMRAAALRKGEDLIAAAHHEAVKVRDGIDHELADKRAAADREAAAVRAAAEREVAQLKAAAKREHDEIVLAARRKAEEIRIREQRLLEESEALRTQAEAELEIELAARREQAERAESERHGEAVVATRKLVDEAERRAATAEERAAAVAARNEQVEREANERARQLVDDAQRDADRVLADVRVTAQQMQAEADAEADRRRAAVQRELDDLTKQKDEVSRHLAQMRQLVGSLLPEGLELPEGGGEGVELQAGAALEVRRVVRAVGGVGEEGVLFGVPEPGAGVVRRQLDRHERDPVPHVVHAQVVGEDKALAGHDVAERRVVLEAFFLPHGGEHAARDLLAADAEVQFVVGPARHAEPAAPLVVLGVGSEHASWRRIQVAFEGEHAMDNRTHAVHVSSSR